MIPAEDREIIVQLAREYGVSRIILFGSSLIEGREAHDIDLGVRGIEPRLFFPFYGDLLMHLSKSVDLVDLAQRSRFTDLIEKNGVVIYG
jgi:predicted nucleotidyltransferase